MAMTPLERAIADLGDNHSKKVFELIKDEIDSMKKDNDQQQATINRLQTKINRQQTKIGRLQAKIGRLQAKIGRQQAKLGRQQATINQHQTNITQLEQNVMHLQQVIALYKQPCQYCRIATDAVFSAFKCCRQTKRISYAIQLVTMKNGRKFPVKYELV